MASDILGPGWNISQKGEEIITGNNTIKDKATLLKNALNSDLKETGAPILTKVLNKTSVPQVVLQIQKIRNIGAPKANENSHVAPRMLKLVLTDGDTYIQAVETASIPSLNLDKTPPGSKLLITSAKICSGYLLLDSSNCSLLGGQVPALYEKWELAKSVQNHNRQSSSSDGPPAWVNFGRKIQSDIQDKSFKSLDNKSQENKESTKFDLQRQDAIAEATSGAIKKVFGGGIKQPMQSAPTPRTKPNDFQNRERKNAKSKISVKEVEDKPLKPSERLSLFDFLEDKLPPNEGNNITQVEAVKPTINYNNPRIAQNNLQNNKNRTYYKSTPNDQNNSYRTKTEIKPQASQNRVDENVVNGLSNNFKKMTFHNESAQFAKRSLKEHLGPLHSPRPSNPADLINFKVGDDCMAVYWEDRRFYEATITAITDKTYVVKFKGYGNIEEVLKTDCFPKLGKDPSRKPQYSGGPAEFRRSARTFKRQ